MFRFGRVSRSFSQAGVPGRGPSRKSLRNKPLMVMFSLFGVGCGAMTFANFYNTEIDVVFSDSEFMKFIVKRVPALFKVASVEQPYVPTFYFPLRFMEVIYCAKVERRPFVKVKEEKVIFTDGETTFLGTRC